MTWSIDEWGFRRVDNITDVILAKYQGKFGPEVTKDDVFSSVYGVLHSEQYRTTFAADLKRMLPRIPLAASTSDFEAFVEAGRRLADIHLNYETIEPYPLAEQTPFVTDPVPAELLMPRVQEGATRALSGAVSSVGILCRG
jgi:predicted helicase